jgi:hypothetical protein
MQHHHTGCPGVVCGHPQCAQCGGAAGRVERTTGDINDNWETKNKQSLGMLDILDLQVALESFAGPGQSNDPDRLEVGNGGMTTPESGPHFSLWSILAAPRIAGNDLRNMSPEIQAILTNKEVIAVNQDRLGIEGAARAQRRRSGSLRQATAGWKPGGGSSQSRCQCERNHGVMGKS